MTYNLLCSAFVNLVHILNGFLYKPQLNKGGVGGPKMYCGKFPVPAHKHMYITEELFDLRHQMLKESISEAGLSDEIRDKWLKIDNSFKDALVKKSIHDCQKRFATDEILAFEDPKKKAA